MDIENNLRYLIDIFGNQHDVRFVPSVLIGGGFIFRVTVVVNARTVSRTGSSYTEAFNFVINDIKEGV